MATSARPAAPRLGIHIRMGAGLLPGVRHAREIGCQTFQFMSGNPSAWSPGGLDPAQALQFRAALDQFDLRPAFLHAGYLINLSCRKGRNAPIYAKSIKLLDFNLQRAADLGCEFVVVHLGSSRGHERGEAVAALVDGLGKLTVPGPAEGSSGAGAAGAVAGEGSASADATGAGASSPPMLLLENSAGTGDSVGSSFAELALVLDRAADAGVPQPLGICLDTAHLWGAGHDLTSGAAARRVIDNFEELVGLDRLHLIHLNDSPVARGSARDRHEHLGKGNIPETALKTIIRDRRLRHVAMILETPGSTNPTDARRMQDLKLLAGTR